MICLELPPILLRGIIVAGIPNVPKMCELETRAEGDGHNNRYLVLTNPAMNPNIKPPLTGIPSV